MTFQGNEACPYLEGIMKKYIIILIILLLPTLAWSSVFGKNKLTQHKFDWFVHKTEHFDIYYYPSESELVNVMADIAEEAYDIISEELGHDIEDKTPLILYKSHADFRETNITLQELHEGVGGFAELFKHRVVIPFTGSMKQFRQVIFHELTHIFQFEIIYQKPVAHIYTGEFMYSPPIWFIEGVSEYFARFSELDSFLYSKTEVPSQNDIIFSWDAKDEMVLREACISNQINHLQDLDYWLPGMNVFLGYKIGESAIKYLAKTYGRDKIALILQEVRHSRTKDLDQAFKNIIGIDIEKFDKEWQNFLKKQYWPMIKDKETPELFAKPLTKNKRYVNNVKPVWLPSGELIAYITNEDEHEEVVLISAKDGQKVSRLTKHLYPQEYETIRTTGNGISISRDGDRLAFIGIKGEKEFLFIQNIITKKIEQKILLNTFGLDIFYSPSWSPEGDRIVLVGVKGGQPDLFTISLSSGNITQITNDRFDDNSPNWHPFKEQIVYSSERDGKYQLIKLELSSNKEVVLTHGSQNAESPSWSSDGKKIVFISDLEGIYDIYIMDLESQKVFRITNTITGCFSPKIKPEFTNLVAPAENSSSTEFITEDKVLFSAYHDGKQDLYVMKIDEAKLHEVKMPEPENKPLLSANKRKTRLLYNKYERKILIDAIFADFQLSSDGVLRNTTQLIASDMMGNHRLGLTVLSQSYNWAPDFIASYAYLRRRADLGVSLFNYHEYHIVSGGYGILQRLTGLVGSLSYPINRYKRIDSNLTLYSTPLDYRFIPPNSKDYVDRILLMIGDLAYVGDTTKWNQFGPYTGARYNLSVEHSFEFFGNGFDMTNISLDARKYFKLGRLSSFATRFFAGGSFGEAYRLYYLGGIDTLRGYKYEELYGTQAGLLNMELRLPFVEEIRFGWPIRWAIQGIRGIVFADFGTVWSKEQFLEKPYNPCDIVDGNIKLVDIKGSIGVGLRLHLGYFTLDFDAARRTNIMKIEPGVIYHFGLGQEF